MQMTGVVSTNRERLLEELQRWLPLAERLTDQQRASAILLNDLEYVATPEARFVLAITAVEALCDQTVRSDEHQRVADELAACLPTISSDPDVVSTFNGVLKFAKRKSIRNAYMTKLRERLGDPVARRFDELYQPRSTYVHEGGGRGQLAGAAGEAREIAVALLGAEVERHLG